MRRTVGHKLLVVFLCFGACLTGWVTLLAGADAVLRVCGYSWNPAAETWQVIIVLITTVLSLASISAALFPEQRILADQVRKTGFAKGILPILSQIGCLILLTLAFFGHRSSSGHTEDDGFVTLVRYDRYFDSDGDNTFPTVYYVANHSDLQIGSGTRLLPGSNSATHFAAIDPETGPVTWIRVDGKKEWPLMFCPDALNVDETFLTNGRLARLTNQRLAKPPRGAPAFPFQYVQANELAQRPDLARIAKKQWWACAVGPEVSVLTRSLSPSGTLFVGPLYEVEQQGVHNEREAHGPTFPLVVTFFRNPYAEELHDGVPVLTSSSEYVPTFYLEWKANEQKNSEPFDLLGESDNGISPKLLMEGCILTWRSRLYSLPGRFSLPLDPSYGPDYRSYDMLTRFDLPHSDPDPAASGLRLYLTAAIILLLAWSFWNVVCKS